MDERDTSFSTVLYTISVGVVPDTVSDDNWYDERYRRISVIRCLSWKFFEIGCEGSIGEDCIFRSDRDRDRDITIGATSENYIRRSTRDVSTTGVT